MAGHRAFSHLQQGIRPPTAPARHAPGFAALNAHSRALLRQLHSPAARPVTGTLKPSSVPGGGLAAPELAFGLSPQARRPVGLWLGLGSAWVGALVVIGGVTRLTRSGLSMTDWKLTGERPPATQQEWEAEFGRYKASPEWRATNRSMTLDGFKFIYYMEWGHRMWGRALGVLFALPAAYFAARGHLSRPLGARLGLLFLMGGAQGFVGWWMVRSGLHEELLLPDKEPRVSPYRLAAHLTSAFAIFSLMVWTTMSLVAPSSGSLSGDPAAAAASRVLRGRLQPLAALVGITAVSGAYVAGNDAGRAFNDWPLMGGEWFPSEYGALPGWRNCFENTAAVQFNHRTLAYATLAAVTTLAVSSRRLPLPPRTAKLLRVVTGVAWLQAALGVLTLVNYVPVCLGVMHQANALALFTAVLAAMHSVRRVPVGPRPALLVYGPTAAAAAAVLGIGVSVTRTV